MNITTSKFYSENSGVDAIYKEFIYRHAEIVQGFTPNTVVMGNIIEKVKKLNSGSDVSYKDLELDYTEGAIYLEETDYVFNILNNYFNSPKDLNTKKAGLISFYVSGFLEQNLDKLDISDNLKTLDGVPLISVLVKEIEDTNIQLGNQLEELYKAEPIIRDSGISIKHLYLNTRFQKALSLLIKGLKNAGYKEPELTNEFSRLSELMTNARNIYLESKSHKIKKSAKYIIEKYNIMKLKTYGNASINNFRGILRTLIPSDKYYITASQYATTCEFGIGDSDE